MSNQKIKNRIEFYKTRDLVLGAPTNVMEDPVNLQFLSAYKNTQLQPLLESKIYRELQKPIEKRNIKYLQELEQQMIDAKITTRISDPIQGDDRIYGYVAETIDPNTRFKHGGFASIEEMLEY